MPGPMGVTTVPLPAFWSSSKNEDDQLKRSPRKEHLCQNPRCAANNNACSTPHPEPLRKRNKGSVTRVRPNNAVCPVSSSVTRTHSGNCGDGKAHGRHAEKHAGCNVACSPRPVETCGGQDVHGSRHAGKYAEGHFASSPRPTVRPRRQSCSAYFHQGSTGSDSEGCKKLSGKFSKDSSRSPGVDSKDSARSTGINVKKSTKSTGNISTESTRWTSSNFNESTGSARLDSKSFSRSMRIDSTESATSSSSGSHDPSSSTPTRSPPTPSKIGTAPRYVQKRTTNNGSSSPGCPHGTSQSLPTYLLSESRDTSCADDHLSRSFVRSGGTAPPNSERDEEELPLMEGLDSLKPSLTSPICQVLPDGSPSTLLCSTSLPQFDGSPIGCSAMSSSHTSSPTNVDSVRRPVDLEPNSLASTSMNGLPVGTFSNPSSPPTMPTDRDPVSRPSNEASGSCSPPSNVPAARLTSLPATTTPEDTTNIFRVAPIRCSLSPTANKVAEVKSDSGFPHGPSTVENVTCRKTPVRPKSRDSDSRSSTIAKMSNAAQMCILKQRLEDDDQTTNSSSLNTISSDSPTESCSIQPSGGRPVSAFYNALYAPDCTVSGMKALEAHLHWQKRTADRKFRFALEIAILSAMVTILVVVFYPAVTRGLRPLFYGCCSCPAAQATLTSRNPSRFYAQPSSYDGCAYMERSLWNCLPKQQPKDSTVVK